MIGEDGNTFLCPSSPSRSDYKNFGIKGEALSSPFEGDAALFPHERISQL